jgi:hypothetical protein
MALTSQILKRLNLSISVADQFLSKLKGPTQWEVQPFAQPFPFYLADHCESVKGLLLELGKFGAPSLRRIARLDFRQYVSDDKSARWVPSVKTLKQWIHGMKLVKAALEASRKRVLGISRVVREKKAKGPLGRPKKQHIDLALRLLRDGMRRHASSHPDRQERWEFVFKKEVCPYFQKKVWPEIVENWAGTEAQIKKATKNLRDSCHARGGVGGTTTAKKAARKN